MDELDPNLVNALGTLVVTNWCSGNSIQKDLDELVEMEHDTPEELAAYLATRSLVDQSPMLVELLTTIVANLHTIAGEQVVRIWNDMPTS